MQGVQQTNGQDKSKWYDDQKHNLDNKASEHFSEQYESKALNTKASHHTCIDKM